MFVEETRDQERALSDLIVAYDALEVTPLDDGTRRVKCIIDDVVACYIDVDPSGLKVEACCEWRTRMLSEGHYNELELGECNGLPGKCGCVGAT